MTRVPALGVTLSLVALMLIGLELGPLLRLQPLLQPGELAVQRALMWTLAMCLGVGTFAVLRYGSTIAARLRPSVESVEPPDDRALRPEVLSDLVGQMSEGVVGFDPNGRVSFSNPAAAQLLGRRAIPTGTPMAAFSDIPRLRSTTVQALRNREIVVRELEIPGPPRRTVTLRATPTSDEGAVLVLLDVSDIRKMERSWRDFIANASHELRTPAAAILANLEALTSLTSAPAEVRERFGRSSYQQAQRLAALVSDLMDLVRIESGQQAVNPEAVNLAALVERVVSEHGITDEDAAGRLSVQVDPDALIWADTVALTQVLSNLLTNALRYTDAEVRVVGRGRGHLVRIEVRDHGPGIPEAHRTRVFERFHRVDPGRSRDLGGTGLGLSIVRELVDTMGGTLGVLSNEPRGSVFWVELPRADAAGRAVASA